MEECHVNPITDGLSRQNHGFFLNTVVQKVGIIRFSDTFPFLFLFSKVSNHLYPGGSVILEKNFYLICQEYVTVAIMSKEEEGKKVFYSKFLEE